MAKPFCELFFVWKSFVNMFFQAKFHRFYYIKNLNWKKTRRKTNIASNFLRSLHKRESTFKFSHKVLMQMIILHPPGPIFIRRSRTGNSSSVAIRHRKEEMKKKIKRWNLFNAVGKSTKYNQSIRMYYYCTLTFVWSTIIGQYMRLSRIRTVLVFSYSYVLLSFFVFINLLVCITLLFVCNTLLCGHT